MIIILHRSFEKKYVKLRPAFKEKFKQRRDLFLEDSFHPFLNNHALHGKYEGFRSINVTGDIRAIFKQLDEVVIFVDIGDHPGLYRK